MADLQRHIRDGFSHRQALALLCSRYGISDRYAWQLIHRRQKQTSLKSPTQVGLFD
ncbi:mor transcription activator family protein, partial [Salmonella enterica subsp. enterica serovar Newport]|nr:mor transcription activator family protein [Salmonella enterica subsp. enterica serovar Newport]